jgi:hypothetical protein
VFGVRYRPAVALVGAAGALVLASSLLIAPSAVAQDPLSGIPALLDRLIELALERHREKQRNLTSI